MNVNDSILQEQLLREKRKSLATKHWLNIGELCVLSGFCRSKVDEMLKEQPIQWQMVGGLKMCTYGQAVNWIENLGKPVPPKQNPRDVSIKAGV